MKDTLSICLIGHVDAGKSTLNGRILLDLGLIDPRLLEKYKQESTLLNRSSWYLSWLSDTSDSERQKGKTMEMNSSYFFLPNNKIIINDTPGHKLFVHDMIKGSFQSDISLLLVSAKKGEFESGFLKDGQTREHIILSKAGNIKRLIVVINKMDDVDYDRNRFFFILKEINNFLKIFYKDIVYIPVSSFLGKNILYEYERGEFLNNDKDLEKNLERVLEKNLENLNIVDNNKIDSNKIDKEDNLNIIERRNNITSDNLDEMINKTATLQDKEMNWYKGQSLLGLLNSLKIKRDLNFLQCTILESTKNAIFMRIESGILNKEKDFIVLPRNLVFKILNIFIEEMEVKEAKAGEVVRIKGNIELLEGDTILENSHTNIENNNIENTKNGINMGNIENNPTLLCGSIFTCSFTILNLKKSFCLGYKLLLHLRMSTENIKIIGLQKETIDKKIIKIKYAKKNEKIFCKIQTENKIFLRKDDFFCLRDRDLTVGVGKVRKIIE